MNQPQRKSLVQNTEDMLNRFRKTQSVIIDIEHDRAYIARKPDCNCLNVGKDDGKTTCWPHHDCQNSDCTHQDGDDLSVDEFWGREEADENDSY